MSERRCERLPMKPYGGLEFICPHRGIALRVKWASDGHVQFDNGTSCAMRDWPMFYGGAFVQVVRHD